MASLRSLIGIPIVEVMVASGRVVAWPLSVVMRIWHLPDCAERAERGDVGRRGVLSGEVCCREREGQSLGNFLVFAKHLPPTVGICKVHVPVRSTYLGLTFTCSSLFQCKHNAK